MTNKAEGTHLVSDEQIIKTSESYADLMMTKNDGESYSTHLSGCEYGSKNIRDIYEADRSALLREKNEAVKNLRELFSMVQALPGHTEVGFYGVMTIKRVRAFLSTLTPDQK
jgi:hypothetical protein